VTALPYRLCLADEEGRLVAAIRIYADDDRAATAEADSILRIAERAEAYELWEGRRKVASKRRSR
jgi:hypothetical protein